MPHAEASSPSAPGTEVRPQSMVPGGSSSGPVRTTAARNPGTEAHDRFQATRRARFAALKLLHTFSSLRRVRNCQRVRIGQGPVEVKVRPDHRAHFGNLQTCGSIWTCPVCSAKILAKRGEELTTAITKHTADGGDVLMLTLTMRHHNGERLDNLWSSLTEAWRSASSGARSVREFLEGTDWAKRVEVTHGAHGWHVHIHALLFVEKGTDPAPIGDLMFAAWSARLVSQGHEAPELGPGMSIKRLDLQEAAGEVADYLSKGTYEELRSASRAALELASSSKQGRGGNRTPFQVLADFEADGQASDAELWREWEEGSFNRRSLTWSAGARDRLVAAEELTDVQAAQETDGAGVCIAEVDPGAWKRIVAHPKVAQVVLAGVESVVAGTLVPLDQLWRIVDSTLDRHGFPGAVRPPQAVPESEP